MGSLPSVGFHESRGAGLPHPALPAQTSLRGRNWCGRQPNEFRKPLAGIPRCASFRAAKDPDVSDAESQRAHGRPVSRILSTAAEATAGRPFIFDACCQTSTAAYPDLWSQSHSAVTPHEIPIRHCSRRGLPCRSGCPSRGGLLPHRFTLARLPGRSVRGGAFPRGAPAGRYPAPSLCGVRTFLP